jgi:hypothetical protein
VNRAGASGPWAVSDWAIEQAACAKSRIGAARTQWVVGCRRPQARIVYPLLFFPEDCFNGFLSNFLGKFYLAFSIQIIPTKILFREFKSDKKNCELFKVNESYSCFRCK